jgi:hypothetical protein
MYHTLGNENCVYQCYLSPAVQNGFTTLLANQVRSEIITTLKNSEYYSLMFDCAPESSHEEQMSEILRYVYITEGNVTTEESFVDFISTHRPGVSIEILNKIEQDGLDTKHARGQSYDNGANMAGIYKRVQARMLQVNEVAKFIPCSAHSLHLACCHAAQASSGMTTFLGTVQLFCYRSTARWDILTSCLNHTLKRHCDTRYSSKLTVIEAMHDQLLEIKVSLQKIFEESLDAETKSTARSLLKNIYYKFVCNLTSPLKTP